MTARLKQANSRAARLKLPISFVFTDFPADREETPGERRARTVDAARLRALAADPRRVVGAPVSIVNAVVEEEVDFSFATFEGGVTFAGTRFERPVSFEGARFKRHANFSRCHFAGGLTFRAATADFDLLLPEARVPRGNFIGLTVGRSFDATLAEFGEEAAVADGKAAEFANAAFRQAIFELATFRGNTTFRGARVDLELDLRGACFEQKADLERTVVGAELYCCPTGRGADSRPTTFAGEANFYGCTFRGIAWFNQAVFGGKALFGGCVFENHAVFEGASVVGSASWVGASVARNLDLDRASFRGDVSFRHASVSGEVMAVGTRFGGELDFTYAKVEGAANFHPFVAVSSHFRRIRPHADARSRTRRRWSSRGRLRRATPTTVSGPARFDWAVFERSVNMGGVRFEDEVSFVRAELRDSLSFEGATRFGGSVSFWYASVAGSLSFVGAEFADYADFTELKVARHASWGVEGQKLRLRFPQNAVFTGAQFGGDLELAGVEFGQEAYFADVHVGGRTSFIGSTFEGVVTFNGARFADLHFRAELTRDRGEEPEQFRRAVFFAGTRYARIDVAYGEILDQVDSQHDEPFLLLEKTLRALGKGHDADEVYRMMRLRNARRLKERSRLRWLADAAYGVFAGYGRRPDLLAYYSLGVLALGTFVFQLPAAVVPKDPPAGVTSAPVSISPWEAAGVSLHQFLPLDIPSGGAWELSDERITIGTRPTIAFRTYATFHTLWGYLLVPLFVGAVSGLLQRKRET